MAFALPVVSLCDGCGRCCEHIGMPPFEARNPDLGPDPAQRGARNKTGGWWVALADMETFDRMPAALRAEHAAAVAALDADPTGRPCVWLDPGTKRCRNYEYRPVVCREFEPGEPRCGAILRGAKCQWQDDNEPVAWRNPRVKRTPDEARRAKVGWLRWRMERLQDDFRDDRYRGWNVFEAVLRRFWLGRARWFPSRRAPRRAAAEVRAIDDAKETS